MTKTKALRGQKITVEWLTKKKAWEDQIELFKEFLGKRKFIYITAKNLIKADKFGLNVRWLIPRLRSSDDLRKIVIDAGIGGCIYWYAMYADEQPRDDIRDAIIASGHVGYIYGHVRYIDEQPRDDMRDAIVASGDAYYIERYKQFEEAYNDKN